jgi:hypothetical protein
MKLVIYHIDVMQPKFIRLQVGQRPINKMQYGGILFIIFGERNPEGI